MQGLARAAATAAVLTLMLFALPASASADPPACTDASHTIPQGSSLPLTGQCTGGDGALSYSVVTWPSHGSLSGSTDGTATYTPVVTYSGMDSFKYRATDSLGQFDEATVTINITPVPGAGGLPPSCPESVGAFVPLGGTVRVQGNCNDPERATISYGLSTPPTRGTLAVVAFDTVDYTHTAGNYLSDSFGYTASDGYTQVPGTVDITITDPGVSSYSTGGEATEAEPFQATVDTASAAGVTVGVRETSTPPPEGYFFLGQEYNITAPEQTIDDPIRLTFTIDRSEVPPAGGVEIFRDDEPITTLCDGSGHATPDDPCIVSRGFIDSSDTSDYRIVVLTQHASRWNTGAGKKWTFDGFNAPVNGPPTVNTGKAGRSVPVKFSLRGDRGLGVLAAGSPSSTRVNCTDGAPADPLETTGTESKSSLQYDPLTDTYTYVWKTSGDWAGTCRKLSVAFADADPTAYEALFQFK